MNYKVKHIWLSWLVMFAMIFSLITPAGLVKADGVEVDAQVTTENTTTVSIRVEAKDDVILERPITLENIEGRETTAYDALIEVLDEEDITYEVNHSYDTPYIEAINEIISNETGGWLYSVYRNETLDERVYDLGMAQFPVQDDDEIVVYYTEWGTWDQDEEEVDEPKDNAEIEDTNVLTQEIEKATNKIINYYREKGVPGNDDVVLALNSLGEDINRGPYTTNDHSYAEVLLDRNLIANKGQIPKSILAIQSLGYDPTSFGGNNLVKELQNYSNPSINISFFALIALDTAKAEETADTQLTREILIEQIVKGKLAKGGWTFFGDEPTVDMTAMGIYALAPHKNRPEVEEAINQGIQVLKEMQADNGGYIDMFTGHNSQSSAQVIQALTAAGEDPQGIEFTKKNGNNPVTDLLSFQLDNGAFSSKQGGKEDLFATPQALQALAALNLFYDKGESTLYSEIHYAGDIPPALKPYEINSASIQWESGIYITTKISQVDDKDNDPVYIVFQLFKDEEPISMVSLKESIEAEKEVSAFFNVSEDDDYRVKVLLLDQLTNPMNIGKTLAFPIELRQ
ncbi:hypothetical protein BEP19_13570 [Ammoniphilus oxalaticus]|uniref:DUF4430 domain-containing protein n=1 Tax=Ammoniphilus oxalaticus TaxID=66863 RepID=A0A419SF49_9BACL|nr:DUF4430 domain-containing protein [Ammoniphilus oxalaticus]RKD22093.1 hypothetical protein BEP19_13570 [Ammoniphilus oxalaticus]